MGGIDFPLSSSPGFAQGRIMVAAATRQQRPPSRSPELQDPLNRYLYHPLSARLARFLLPTGLSPNTVSIAGALTVWAAAWAYLTQSWPMGAGLGLALHMLWHVVDGADGDLARLRGGGSPLGELIDGLSDYAGHAVLYAALAALLDDSIGPWAWALALAAGLSHIVQANHAESQRRAYLWWVYGVPWLRHARPAGGRLSDRGGPFSRSFGPLIQTYLSAASAMTPHIGRIDALLDQAKDDPVRLARMRARIREACRGSLQWQKLLGANPRTILLGASMIATASPLAFFLVQALALNLLLAASIRYHRALGVRLELLLND
ncbi:MAG: CDP-alcohol phosphatidyltransferase family protein [Sphingomonas sp.]